MFNGWQIIAVPNNKYQSVDWTAHDNVATTVSPWTGQTQTYDWQSSRLSGVVTLPPQQGATAAAWTGFLLSCRGPLNAFVISDSSQVVPFGQAGINLTPDPNFLQPIGSVWSQPDANWFIANGLGYASMNSIVIAGADSGNQGTSLSSAISLQAGQPYTLSCYFNASALTSGHLGIAVTNNATTVNYAAMTCTGGAQQLTTTFTAPAGVNGATTAIVYIGCELSGATFPLNSIVSFSNILLNPGAPVVNGASQTGYSVVTNGWIANTTGVLLPGDYITIMSAPINAGDIYIPRLYRITQQADTDASGNSTLSIWPQLRESPATGAKIITHGTSGLFRLAPGAKPQWHKSFDSTMQMSFPIVEAQ
jgi:hypothetical protein